MSNSIPTKPCFKCGKPTNETQSVFGVGHDSCYRKAQLPLPMAQFLHSHPMWGKGIRALYHIVNGKCTYMVYLPDQQA